MKKILTICLLAICMVCLLAACGDSSSSASNKANEAVNGDGGNSAAETKNKTTITDDDARELAEFAVCFFNQVEEIINSMPDNSQKYTSSSINFTLQRKANTFTVPDYKFNSYSITTSKKTYVIKSGSGSTVVNVDKGFLEGVESCSFDLILTGKIAGATQVKIKGSGTKTDYIYLDGKSVTNPNLFTTHLPDYIE